MGDRKISLDDITDKCFCLVNPVQKDKFLDLLFGENITHELLGGENSIYRVSPKVYDYLIQEGFELEQVEVKNLGSLSLEERNRIKTQQKERARKNKDSIIEKICEKYGIES